MSDLISREAALDAIEWTWAGKAAFDAIKALPSAQQWIPVTERLPEPPSFCLVTTDGSHNDVIDIALFMSDGWHKASAILAWMPLPGAYKGGNDG